MNVVQDTKNLGALIRLERKRQQLTQEQLAALAGVGPRFVRELELGKETCRLGLMMQVAKTLGLIISVASRGGDAL